MTKTLPPAFTLPNLNWAATAFLGNPTRQTDSAAPLQKAIDAPAAQGGGTLLTRKGNLSVPTLAANPGSVLAIDDKSMEVLAPRGSSACFILKRATPSLFGVATASVTGVSGKTLITSIEVDFNMAFRRATACLLNRVTEARGKRAVVLRDGMLRQ